MKEFAENLSPLLYSEYDATILLPNESASDQTDFRLAADKLHTGQPDFVSRNGGLPETGGLQTSEQLATNIEEDAQHNIYVPASEPLPANMAGEMEVILANAQQIIDRDYNPPDQASFVHYDQEETVPLFHGPLPGTCPPPATFLPPKCALWDCIRPAQETGSSRDYCFNIHKQVASDESAPGKTPLVCRGGIDLKDSPLFAALYAKSQGKNVGIPECEGAANSPWNAELFDLEMCGDESIREWLFFDKSWIVLRIGNRLTVSKHDGRGWRQLQNQVMEDGRLKRSCYVDPQPLNGLEWHLYEYKINDCDAGALYKLELKLGGSRKRGKGGVKP